MGRNPVRKAVASHCLWCSYHTFHSAPFGCFQVVFLGQFAKHYVEICKGVWFIRLVVAAVFTANISVFLFTFFRETKVSDLGFQHSLTIFPIKIDPCMRIYSQVGQGYRGWELYPPTCRYRLYKWCYFFKVWPPFQDFSGIIFYVMGAIFLHLVSFEVAWVMEILCPLFRQFDGCHIQLWKKNYVNRATCNIKIPCYICRVKREDDISSHI